MNPNPTYQDIDELPVFHKRRTFMTLFFEVHNKQKEDSLISLKESYHKTELIFIKRYGAKGYKSDESFLRSYYYHLGSKQPHP